MGDQVQFGPRSLQLIEEINRQNRFFNVLQGASGIGGFGSMFTQPDKAGVSAVYNLSTNDWEKFGEALSTIEEGRRNQIINTIFDKGSGGGYTQDEVDFWNRFTEKMREGTYNRLVPELNATVESHAPQRLEPISSVNNEINHLQNTLHAGLFDKLEQAGAGNFTDSMVAATTLACVERGISAANIANIGINEDKNIIYVTADNNRDFVSIDAFSAAKVNPEETLLEANQLHAQLSQQVEQRELDRQLQLAQQQEEHSGMKIG